MHLLWLLLIPVTVFFVTLLFVALLKFTFEANTWWAVPLYMALGSTLMIGAITLIISILYLTFS